MFHKVLGFTMFHFSIGAPGFGRDSTSFLTSRLPAEAEAVDWEAALKRTGNSLMTGEPVDHAIGVGFEEFPEVALLISILIFILTS